MSILKVIHFGITFEYEYLQSNTILVLLLKYVYFKSNTNMVLLLESVYSKSNTKIVLLLESVSFKIIWYYFSNKCIFKVIQK